MTSIFIAKDLAVAFVRDGNRVEALRGVNFAVDRGEKAALIGESGSGKSTIALALAGLLPHGAIQTGTLSWPAFGNARPAAGRDIGYVFQDPWSSLDPMMSVGDQVAEVIRTRIRTDWSSARREAVALLDAMHLPSPHSLAQAYPHQLSGGQRQRIGIAAAIAGRPALLIADEPTSALDTVVQAAIGALIKDLCDTRQMTLLMITHDIALASTMADRLIVMKDGEIVESGETAQIVRSPAQAYTRRLIEACLRMSDDARLPAVADV